ncbi:MAG: hypothetical protein KC502_17875 [Myxococcales bacterium]|nr:hypothetical protein [Myxococcales bacterium]
MSGERQWEYRPPSEGRGAHWAREPDAFERAVGGEDLPWLKEGPEAPSDITRVAGLLSQAGQNGQSISVVAPNGDIWRLQTTADSADPAAHGPVVTVTKDEPDARVSTFGDRPPEADELAALLGWCLQGGAHVGISCEAWRGLASSHPLVEQMRATIGMRCALYEDPSGLGATLTETAGAQPASRDSGALLNIDWSAEVGKAGWDLYFWMDGDDASWRAVQALVPSSAFLDALVVGQIAVEEGLQLSAAISDLHAVTQNIPLSHLADLAKRFDALGLAHHLRAAVPEEHGVESGTSYGIFVADGQLVWRHPPVSFIAAPDLAVLALSGLRDVVPPGLVSACRQALESETAESTLGLFWWQLGVELAYERLFEPVRLGDALRWAEGQSANEADTARWAEGLLALGEATMRAQGPLVAVLATRLTRFVGAAIAANALADSGNAAARCLHLTALRDRKGLLGDLGMTLSGLASATLQIQSQARPSHDARSVPAGRGQEMNNG